MRERVRNILVGACAIGALGSAATMLFLFGELGALAERTWTVRVQLPSAPGLRTGSLVTMHGVPIGRIKSVTMLERPLQRTVGDPNSVLDRVAVELAIKDEFKVSSDSVARIKESLLGGGASIDLGPADEAGGPAAEVWSASKPQPSNRALHGTSQGIEDRLVANFKPTLDKFEKFAEEYTRLGESLNGLLDEAKPGEAPKEDSLRETVIELRNAIQSVTAVTEGAGKLFLDETFLSDIRSAAARLDGTMQAIAETMNGIPALVKSESAEWRRHVEPTLTAVAEATGEFKLLATDIRAGKGTIGRLIQDPVLHESMVELVDRLGQAIAAIERAVETLRSEGFRFTLN